MQTGFLKRNAQYWLLIVPTAMAILALNGFGFFFKSGSAAGGILIILLLFYKQLKLGKDLLLIILAFLFSIIGDWFMSHRSGNDHRFITGIGMFFIAHIGYLVYSIKNGKIHLPVTMLLVGGFLLLFFLKFFPAINSPVLLVATLAYLLISCFSLGAATGIQASRIEKFSYILGIFLVLFSDTIIAFSAFCSYTKLNWLILPTYYLAHLCVTFSLIARFKKQSSGN